MKCLPAVQSSPRRSASTILLVLVLTAIAAIAIMTFFSTVRQERSRTGKLVQRIRAQATARRVVARIIALVQQRPWSDRFFREDRYSFYSSEGLLKEEAPEFNKGEVSYEGSCQQLSAQNKRYRLKLRVKYPSPSLAERDYSYFSSWDLQYSEGILGNLNRTHILASAESDDPDVPEDDLDRQLDLIRNTARNPSNDPQLAGNPGEPYVDDVRKAEEQQEGVKAGELGRPPTDLLPVPPSVDGANAPGTDPLDPIKKAIGEAAGGQPPATSTPSPSPSSAPETLTRESAATRAAWMGEVLRVLASIPYGEMGYMEQRFIDEFVMGTGTVSHSLVESYAVGGSASAYEANRQSGWFRDAVRNLPANVRARLPPCPW